MTKIRTLLITLGVASTLGVMVTYVREAGMGMTPADASRYVRRGTDKRGRERGRERVRDRQRQTYRDR